MLTARGIWLPRSLAFILFLLLLLVPFKRLKAQEPPEKNEEAEKAQETLKIKEWMDGIKFPRTFDGDDRCNRMTILMRTDESGTTIYDFKPFTKIPIKAELYDIIVITEKKLFLERHIHREGPSKSLRFQVTKNASHGFNSFKIEYTEGSVDSEDLPYEATIECFVPLYRDQ